MKKLNLHVRLERLNNAEHGAYHLFVSKVLEQFDLSQLGIPQVWWDDYQAARRQLLEWLHYPYASSVTVDIRAVDERRTQAYLAILHQLRYARYVMADELNDEETFYLGALLRRFRVMLRYADTPTRDVRMDGLCILLERHLPRLVERLGLTPQLEAVRDCTQQLSLLRSQRITERLAKTGRKLQEARRQADRLYRAMVLTLEARLAMPATTADEEAARDATLRCARQIGELAQEERTQMKKHVTWLHKADGGEAAGEEPDAQAAE